MIGAYVLGILPILHPLLGFTLTNELQIKKVAFADDLIIMRKIADIKAFGDQLATTGTKHGYFLKATKSYVIVKKLPERYKGYVYWHEYKDHN